MSNGVVIHLDNDSDRLKESKGLFDQLGLELKYITCENKEGFKKAVKEHRFELKSIVFDLIGEEEREEEFKGDPEFLEYIQNSFASFNIPIFIYSGYLDALGDRFEQSGTVYKVDKGDGPDKIFATIRLLIDSGFIDVFCPGGELERQLHVDLHDAFTKQFTSNEHIEGIINQVLGSGDEDPKSRLKKVLKRVAIRSLLTELLSPSINAKGHLVEESVNTIEHYVQRINAIQVWTGDIFTKKDKSDYVFVLTPRCNVIRDEMILVCPFRIGEIITKKDKVSKMLQGDPQVSGYDRYLPPAPGFDGGRLALSKYFMLSKESLCNEYDRVISLSDELTNEILGKFGAFFFRTGITPWSTEEVLVQLNGN